jgi:hypothetical protein
MFKTRRNRYGKQLKNKKTCKNRRTIRKRGKKGGFLSTTGFGIGDFKFNKTQGARMYNLKTGQWDYQDCYAVGPIKWCQNRAP